MSNQEIVLLPVALELDEQWSFVGNKSNQRWLWLALNHYNSEVLAYTFGDRTDAAEAEATVFNDRSGPGADSFPACIRVSRT